MILKDKNNFRKIITLNSVLYVGVNSRSGKTFVICWTIL